MKANDLRESAMLVAATLPPQTISEDVLLEKYAKAGDTNIDDVRRRVANALTLVERPDSKFRVPKRSSLAVPLTKTNEVTYPVNGDTIVVSDPQVKKDPDYSIPLNVVKETRLEVEI